MNSMNTALASLNEAMADDRRLRDQLAQLNANILQLSADLQRDRTQQTNIVASELRALSSSIAKLISEKSAPRPVPRASKDS
jgi:cob(I)alamin adenosyltransferase